jgi:hypothetical protein
MINVLNHATQFTSNQGTRGERSQFKNTTGPYTTGVGTTRASAQDIPGGRRTRRQKRQHREPCQDRESTWSDDFRALCGN